MRAFLEAKGFNVGDWVYGMIAAAIQGGASAVASGLGLIAIDPNDFNFQTGRFYAMVGAMFAVNSLLGMMAYLKQKPLPSRVAETVTTRTEVSAGPPATTITTNTKETITESAKQSADLKD